MQEQCEWYPDGDVRCTRNATHKGDSEKAAVCSTCFALRAERDAKEKAESTLG
jgi:hypothetical protein